MTGKYKCSRHRGSKELGVVFSVYYHETKLAKILPRVTAKKRSDAAKMIFAHCKNNIKNQDNKINNQK